MPPIADRPIYVRPRARLALTLVEMVVALAITSIIIGAATSIMFVASRALPDPSDPVVLATDAASALALLEAEAQCATRTNFAGSTLAISIPDRDADLAEELITYRWSGTPGDPLERVEDAIATTLVPNVQNASFTWTPPRNNDTRVGVLYITLTLDRGLMVFSTVRLINEPENNL
ncbi:MAG: prepilin-type N-terminal cleavage/methylation domain-containing protein [Phycisphaerales bacterium]|nr:prepilin-type N-terminal cleavage/methylation domain-containing protein [Phycisphaerales bacterium]